jgi:threonine synthase
MRGAPARAGGILMDRSSRAVIADGVVSLVCIGCGESTSDPWEWGCTTCGPAVRRDVRYAEDAGRRMRARLAGRPFDMWRYAELLPVNPPAGRNSPLAVGGTPVLEPAALASHLGVSRVVVKDEAKNLSGSLKDRATAVGVSLALADERKAIACASTGNAAASTATLAAAVGLPAVVLIPERTAAGKLAQLRACGAVVCRVAASYDDVWDLCSELSERAGWLNRNCAVNPYLVEGKKTTGLELAEQLGADMTDWVAVGVGDGCTIAGIAKGLVEAHAAGMIPRLPRLLGVQPEGVQPLVRAFHDGAPPRTNTPQTLADGLNVGRPRNAARALRAVRELAGSFVAVSDEAIFDAIGWVARRSGVLAEPASAAAFAGVAAARAAAIVAPGESVCIVNTGTGLKDPAAIDRVRSLAEPMDISRDVAGALAAIARSLEYLDA